jgi:hypothetical protein
LVIEEIREEIKNFLKFKENENTTFRTYEIQQGQSKRKVYSHECI